MRARSTTRLLAALATTLPGALALPLGAASAAPLPNKLLLSSHFGREVDRSSGANVCTVASKDECQPGRESGEADGFAAPKSVAVDNDPASAGYGHVYVADTANHRIQELTADGRFLAMFGGEVNRKGGDVCTAAEEGECQAGVEGQSPGQFGLVDSVAVDPASGEVYVADTFFGRVNEELQIAQRVQAFTTAGQFLFEIGKEVNQTTKGNVCAAGEACAGAALQTFQAAEANTEVGAFSFEGEAGNLLAVGGPEDLLYVGDHARVQRFHAASGQPAGSPISLSELSPTGRATGVAVDSSGDIFVSDSEAPGVHEYDAAGALQPLVIDPTSSGVRGVAIDPHGRLGIIDREGGTHGALYSAAGAKISEFAPPQGEMPGSKGLAFAASGDAYVAEEVGNEVEAYAAVVFPETRTCAPSEVTGTSARLCGEVNPDGVRAAGFFQYGPGSSLGFLTPSVFEGQGEAFEPVSYQLNGLEPNQSYQYRVAAEAEVGGERVRGHGEALAFETLVVPPQIAGQPSTSFVTSQSALLNAALNPEHAATRYRFEYGPCPSLAGCAAVQSTPEATSSAYGTIPAIAEVSGLAPATTYSFRLVADNKVEKGGTTVGGQAIGPEGSFTTAPPTAPSAETGPYSAVTATGAVISGVVRPNGLPATYAFEVGVYEGASTQYGVVFSASAGSARGPVDVSFALAGLQPGTVYAYRIAVSSGYIQNETNTIEGSPVTFTTAGLPSVLAPPALLAQLATPNVEFPAVSKPPTKAKKKHRTIRRRHRKGRAHKRKARHRRGR
jgi:hypothetical protein